VSQTLIGVLHPGEMGAAVGGCLAAAGHPVLWASAGRSPGTGARAEAAGLRDAGTMAALSRQADIILSICPPAAALDVARSVAEPADSGFRGLFVDANAISPGTAREVCAIVQAAGASYVDGGIIGPPPDEPGSPAGSTRLYLSGSRAAQVRDLFRGTALDARAIDGGVGAASAVKMAYAAWTKGTAALILTVRALARAEGVEDILLAEWQESQPGLADRSRSAASSAAAKGWRWDGEMEEIAVSMAAAGLPSGFHQAAAEIFRRSPRGGAAPADERTVASILDALRPAF
jgi:3-hydroxyisobutyrate dehydrogenase-like beta-hydroxyacid dehydrogenase